MLTASSGWLAAGLTTACYMIGAGRTFSFDSAITFANFVATPSLREVLGGRTAIEHSARSLTGINDHVLLSLLSHVLWMATGTHSEWVYRLLPAIAAGAAVGLVCAFLVGRFGLLAGLAGTAFMATDPVWVENSRELRGYSLMVLFVVLATAVLRKEMTRRRVVIYTALMTAALASHLFAAFVILVHLTYVAVVRRHALVKLLPAWSAAIVLGLTCNALAMQNYLLVMGVSHRQFQLDAAKDVISTCWGPRTRSPSVCGS